MFRTGEPDKWLHFLTFSVALIMAAALFSAGLLQRDTSDAGAQERPVPTTVAETPHTSPAPSGLPDQEPVDDTPATTVAPEDGDDAVIDPVAVPTTAITVPAAGDAATPTVPPKQTTTSAAPVTSTTQAAPPATTAPAPTTTAAPLVTADVPTPPTSRFVPGDVSSLLNSTGGQDPVGGALEILRRSGPLGQELADQPIVAERLTEALDGAQLFGARDYADRILGAVNSALDTLASERAEAGTGLCLIVGAGQCVQVPDLNHTFSAMPHRGRVDAAVDAYGNTVSAQRIGQLADLHFTGNGFSILREAHHVALTTELRHAWMKAGVSLELASAETTAHLTFLRAYLDAARDERVETWKIMLNDGTGTGVATTWNMLVAAFATDDDAYWNIAFLPDASSIVDLTGGAAGSARPAA